MRFSTTPFECSFFLNFFFRRTLCSAPLRVRSISFFIDLLRLSFSAYIPEPLCSFAIENLASWLADSFSPSFFHHGLTPSEFTPFPYSSNAGFQELYPLESPGTFHRFFSEDFFFFHAGFIFSSSPWNRPPTVGKFLSYNPPFTPPPPILGLWSGFLRCVNSRRQSPMEPCNDRFHLDFRFALFASLAAPPGFVLVL